jgi:hypothetical protein
MNLKKNYELSGLVDADEDDDKYVKEYGMSQKIYLLDNPLYSKAGHPKFILASN